MITREEMTMLRNEGGKLSRVVVCTPEDEYFNVKNLKEQHMHVVADRDKTRRQFAALKSIMETCGCEVIDVPGLADHANSVFTRDTALCTPQGYIKVRMGLPARRGEEEWMAKILESMGEPCAGEINEPGTVEGGDVILAGAIAFVGLSKRTNREGAKQISGILSRMNYEIRTVKVQPPHLHLGGAMSVVGPQQILCCRDMFPNDFFKGFDTVDMSCGGISNGNVICLGDNEMIANAAENAEAIEALEKKGMIVHGIDLSEFRKGAGGPTCLILPVERK
jgi:dimethylargininase